MTLCILCIIVYLPEYLITINIGSKLYNVMTSCDYLLKKKILGGTLHSEDLFPFSSQGLRGTIAVPAPLHTLLRVYSIEN